MTRPANISTADLAETKPSPAISAPRSKPRPGVWARLSAPPVVLAAILIVAAAIRLWRIGALGFNSDEAVYAGQAAAIAGVPMLSSLFPVFRAHPLLFQMAVSLMYRVHVSDLTPRLLAVAFGLGTVIAGYAAGARIYGRRAGQITALLLALMPYLVVVNRQALLDGPMAFFTVVALWLLAKFADEGRPRALYAAGAALGLALISKETSIVMVPAAYAFLALTPSVRVKLTELVRFFASTAVVALPYPVSLAVAGGSRSGQHFLTWQLFRPANHVWSFYLAVVPVALGIPVLVCGVVALAAAAAARRWSWRESLLVCWAAVPVLFFQLWPVKGYQYLLPIAAPVAVLAAGLATGPAVARLTAAAARKLGSSRLRAASVATLGMTALLAGWLGVVSWQGIDTANSTTFLAGTGGVPGGRAAGLWIQGHTPGGSEMLAIGPSMANILEFYGHREVLGLSVSPNPLHRNPVYTPVRNPDFLLRTGQLQYLVWDAYSAARTRYFSQRLMTYVRRYSGAAVLTESVTVRTARGPVRRPVIVIYEVRP